MSNYVSTARYLAQATNAPEYRYIFFDLLTRKVLEELPLYGVSLSRQIAKSAQGTGSFKLGTGMFSDPDLLAATLPGKCGMVALRDSIPVWGGIIWNRTYNSEALTMELSMSTFESAFSRIKMLSQFSATQTDQTTIFLNLINMLQGQPYNNFGWNTSGIQPTGILRNLSVDVNEHHMFQDPIDTLMQQSQTFEWTMDPVINSDGTIGVNIRTGYPYLGYLTAPSTFDYPGQAGDYYWPEGANNGGVRLTYLGKGEGSSMMFAMVDDVAREAAGYPAWDVIVSNKNIADQNQINSMAASAAIQYRIPMVTPTIDLHLDQDLSFTEWSSLGLPFNFYMQDERFPAGFLFPSRMIGWTLTPNSSESVEALKLVLEGDQASG